MSICILSCSHLDFLISLLFSQLFKSQYLVNIYSHKLTQILLKMWPINWKIRWIMTCFKTFLKMINFKDTTLVFKNYQVWDSKALLCFCQQEKIDWNVNFRPDRRMWDNWGKMSREYWKFKLGLKTCAFFFLNTILAEPDIFTSEKLVLSRMSVEAPGPQLRCKRNTVLFSLRQPLPQLRYEKFQWVIEVCYPPEI